MSDQRTPRRGRKATGDELAPTHQDDTIFSAMQSAGEFYKLSTNIASVVNEIPLDPPDPEMPRSLWLRRAFGEWLDDFCARFACSREVVEKMSTIIEMAWYGTGSPERRAPGWLIGWPKAVEREIILAAPERLDAASTWEIEKAILARVGEAFIAQGRGNQWEGELSIVQRIMKANPLFSNWHTCAAVDDECERTNRPIPVPQKCKQHRHETLKDSIECTGDCRAYMAVHLAQERRPLELPKAPRSKLPRKPKLKS